MSKKSVMHEDLVGNCVGRGWDPRYVGFFERFNRGLYFEAHEVLEELWLADRRGPNDSYHKGLIQLAGAFVHLQKDRLRPAVSLFDLAAGNLTKYPVDHEGVRLCSLLELIADWRRRIVDAEYRSNPLTARPAPQLELPRVPARSASDED